MEHGHPTVVLRGGIMRPQRQGSLACNLPASHVKAEGSKIAPCLIVVVDVQRRDGHEELVTGFEVKEASLVKGMEPIGCILLPVLGAHPLQQEDGLPVHTLEIDALHQLVAQGAGIGPLSRVAEVDLGIHVVLARLAHL